MLFLGATMILSVVLELHQHVTRGEEAVRLPDGLSIPAQCPEDPAQLLVCVPPSILGARKQRTSLP